MPAFKELKMKLVYKGIEIIGGKKYVRSTNLGELNPVNADTNDFEMQLANIGACWYILCQFKSPIGTLESTRTQEWSYPALAP